LLRLAGNPQLVSELGRRGRARVLEHFTQRKMAQEVFKLCREVLAARSGMEAAETEQVGRAR
jgi:glycosyltransferase involved in cell wall biosynthesis